MNFCIEFRLLNSTKIQRFLASAVMIWAVDDGVMTKCV